MAQSLLLPLMLPRQLLALGCSPKSLALAFVMEPESRRTLDPRGWCRSEWSEEEETMLVAVEEGRTPGNEGEWKGAARGILEDYLFPLQNLTI